MIAEEGSDWAEKVLRLEDMKVYWVRLLLEYGRVIRDDREALGYDGDGTNTECGLLCCKFDIARVASHVGSQASKYFYVYESICTVIR